MIAVSSSGRSFQALARYLAAGRDGDNPDRVAWTVGRNLPTDEPELAATFMRATAARSDRVEKPVYHIAISFDPGDSVDRATMERVADRVLERLGLAEHEAVIVAHRDRGHQHLHILINRVHPETGKAWERWKDQPIIQQVLREEERALGLREVSGTLAPAVSQETNAGELPQRVTTNGRLEPEGDDRDQSQPPAQQAISRASRVDQVAGDLETRDRIVELTREHYLAQLDVSAACSRTSQLDVVAARARDALDKFDRALGTVFRDPDHARRSYLAAVDDNGTAAATQAMRGSPEVFGALVTVERARAFGLVRDEDDRQARGLAPVAAASGREAIEALQVFGKVAADTQARRLEHAFTRELGEIYQEPSAVRSAFERFAAEHGVKQAGAALREKPDEFGQLRPEARDDRSRVEAHSERAAELGIQATTAREFAKSSGIKIRDPRLEAEPSNSRSESERAVAHEAAIRREVQALPSRADLERHIAQLVDRMSPREVQQLRRVVTAPRFALAMEIRTAIRDMALGRDDDR